MISEENTKIVSILVEVRYCVGLYIDDRITNLIPDEIDKEHGGLYLDIGADRIEYLMPFYEYNDERGNNMDDFYREKRQLNKLCEYFGIGIDIKRTDMRSELRACLRKYKLR